MNREVVAKAIYEADGKSGCGDYFYIGDWRQCLPLADAAIAAMQCSTYLPIFTVGQKISEIDVSHHPAKDVVTEAERHIVIQFPDGSIITRPATPEIIGMLEKASDRSIGYRDPEGKK